MSRPGICCARLLTPMKPKPILASRCQGSPRTVTGTKTVPQRLPLGPSSEDIRVRCHRHHQRRHRTRLGNYVRYQPIMNPGLDLGQHVNTS
jgi:hypothetical protein